MCASILDKKKITSGISRQQGTRTFHPDWSLRSVFEYALALLCHNAKSSLQLAWAKNEIYFYEEKYTQSNTLINVKFPFKYTRTFIWKLETEVAVVLWIKWTSFRRLTLFSVLKHEKLFAFLRVRHSDKNEAWFIMVRDQNWTPKPSQIGSTSDIGPSPSAYKVCLSCVHRFMLMFQASVLSAGAHHCSKRIIQLFTRILFFY